MAVVVGNGGCLGGGWAERVVNPLDRFFFVCVLLATEKFAANSGLSFFSLDQRKVFQ